MRLHAGGRRWSGRTRAVAALALVAACARGSDDPTLQGEVPTTGPTTSSTERARTTTTEPACPPVPSASGAPALAEHTGDVDGDGEDDVARSFARDGEADTVTIQVELAAGGGAQAQVAHEPGFPAALLGTAAVDRHDGRDLLWVRTGAGASTVIVGLYWFHDCELAPVERPNGDRVQLPIGGTVRTVAGARCGSLLDPEADLVVYEGRSVDGSHYEVTASEHRYADGVLTPSPEAEPATERTDDPSQASRLRCGDVAL